MISFLSFALSYSLPFHTALSPIELFSSLTHFIHKRTHTLSPFFPAINTPSHTAKPTYGCLHGQQGHQPICAHPRRRTVHFWTAITFCRRVQPRTFISFSYPFSVYAFCTSNSDHKQSAVSGYLSTTRTSSSTNSTFRNTRPTGCTALS